MTEQTAIDAAARRLSQALDALDAAVERRLDGARSAASVEADMHALDADRARLASELDAVSAHARQLESANREVAGRLDAAMEGIRTVLAADGAADDADTSGSQ